MADMENKPADEEMKIPVFTVLKNGNILKNIVLNYPTSKPESELLLKSAVNSEECSEEGVKLLVGRHPDCDIVLDHLSISRYHLQICLQPFLQRMSVTDLSSVHGTWVSEQRIKPRVAVELKEGDVLRLGASTRNYRLQWVPFSDVFKIENPTNSSAPIPDEEKAYQDENFLPLERKQEDSWATRIPSAPPMPKLLNFSNPFEVSSDSDNIAVKKQSPELEEASSSFFAHSHLEGENHSPPKKEEEPEEKGSLLQATRVAEPVSSSILLGTLLASDALLEIEHCSPESHFEGENQSPWTRPGQQDMCAHSEREACFNAGIEAGDLEEDARGLAEICRGNMYVEQNNRDEENRQDLSGVLGASHTKESVSSSMPLGVLSTISNEHLETVHRSPGAHFTTKVPSLGENQSPPVRLSRQDVPNLWLRRGKSVNLICIQTGRKGTSDAGMEAENQEEIILAEQDERENTTLSKVLFPEDHEDNESILSDKENMTPQVPPSMKLKKGKLKIQHPESLKSSPKVSAANSDIKDGLFPSDKENMTPSFSFEMKLKKTISENQRRIKPEMIPMRRAERVPFQSLLVKSINSKSVSIPNAATSRNSNSVNHTHITRHINSSSFNKSADQAVHKVGESERKWYMVVDTGCLLNEESRKSLKLLEGLKGTHLLIPRMVIRELDCLQRRGSWFKKDNEASLILQWIEECMMNTKWWIHVQSSTDGMPIAPTPPASPRSRLSGGSNEFGMANSVPFSTCGSLMEIVSPTAEDHILECALFFRRIRNGQLVLLTNDTTLKIKAMAEGLICETATEFCESLVNPYSERFLWVQSTPVGPTWSCLGETGMKENYRYYHPARKTAKAAEVAKGLKLILLHNSQYGQIDPVK